MKLLAFVDMHGSLAALKKIEEAAKKDDVDIVLCAGDLTVFGDSMKHLVSRLNKIGKPVLMVHGNHESENSMKKVCEETKNITFIHQKIFEIGGYAFVGYGGGGFSTRDAHFEEWAKKKLNDIKGESVVFLTHAPPYGTSLGKVMEGDAGSKSFADFVKKSKPALMVCGHLHENRGNEDKIGQTRIVNPGPFGKILTV
jgi:Icc-related predicted phosphoesterase